MSGEYVGSSTQSGATDVFGHKYLGGSGKTLEHAIKKDIGCKVRSVELNLPQRCAAHLASMTDLDEAVLVGKSAVRAAVGGVSRVMMTINRVSNNPYSIEIGTVNVHEVANKQKMIPMSFINEEGNGVTDECIEYLFPLIQGEADIRYKDGLPVHIII